MTLGTKIKPPISSNAQFHAISGSLTLNWTSFRLFSSIGIYKSYWQSVACNEKNNGGTAVCFHNPAIDVARGKTAGLVDSEENELGFNICKEESFCYVLNWSESLAVKSNLGQFSLQSRKEHNQFSSSWLCCVYLGIWLNVIYYFSFLNLIPFEIHRKISWKWANL